MRAFGQKNTVLRKVVTWVAAMTLVLSMIPLMDFARAAEECEDHGTETIVETVSTPATCTEDGVEGTIVKCANCKEVIENNTTTTRALGHKAVACLEIAPTCTESGQTGGEFCAKCGETYIEPTVVPAKGHNPVSDDNAVAATCTKNGKTASETCTECGTIVVESEIIEAPGHKMIHHEAKEAKCAPKEENFIHGNYEYWYCTNCEKYFNDKEGKDETTEEAVTIIANHQLALLNGTPADCTTPGYTDGLYCSECGTTFQGDAAQQVIGALGHAKETVFGYPATCTQNGMTNGERCKRCGETIVAQEVIPATGHIYGNWIIDPANNNHYRICGNDSGHVEEADHVYGEWVITEAATIYASGRQQRVCTDCGNAEQAVVAKLAKATVRVQYVNEDGKILTTKHTMDLAKDSAYDMTDVANRIPAGYEADGEPYGDDLAGIADSNKTIFVPVKKVEVAETPEPAAPAATDNDATPVVAAEDTDEGIADEETPLAAPEDEQTIADDENPMAALSKLVEEPAMVITSAASNPVTWVVGLAIAALLAAGVVTLAGHAAAGAAGAASANSTAARRRKND